MLGTILRCINSFTFLNNPITLLPSVYRWGYQNTERGITQLRRHRAGIWTERDCLRTLRLTLTALSRRTGKGGKVSQIDGDRQWDKGLSTLKAKPWTPSVYWNLAMREILHEFLLSFCSIKRKVASWPLSDLFYLSNRWLNRFLGEPCTGWSSLLDPW